MGETATELSLKNLKDLLAAGIVIFLLFQIYKVPAKEIFETNKVVFDTGLLIDTMLISNGDVYAANHNTFNKTISFSQDSVEVGEIKKTKFFFVKDPNIEFKNKLYFQNAEKINLLKKGDTIEMSDKEIISSDQLPCPPIKIGKPNQIIIMPKTNNGYEDDLTENLRLSLEILITKDVQTKDVFDEKTDMLIKIIVSDQKDILKLQIPQDSLQSRKIACYIINKFKLKNSALKTGIVISEDPILKKSENAVIITLSKDPDIIGAIKLISDGIKEAIAK